MLRTERGRMEDGGLRMENRGWMMRMDDRDRDWGLGLRIEDND